MALVDNVKLESEHFQNALKFVWFLFQIDTLYDDQVNARTGYGKSIVFQAIPLLVDILLDQAIGTSTAIIVCPLVSLMLDQVNRLKELGISADAVFQGQDEAVLTDVEDGIFSLVYFPCFKRPKHARQICCEVWWTDERQILGRRAHLLPKIHPCLKLDFDRKVLTTRRSTRCTPETPWIITAKTLNYHSLRELIIFDTIGTPRDQNKLLTSDAQTLTSHQNVCTQAKKTDIFEIHISCISSFNRTNVAWISHRCEACQINRRYQFPVGVSSYSNCTKNLLT